MKCTTLKKYSEYISFYGYVPFCIGKKNYICLPTEGLDTYPFTSRHLRRIKNKLKLLDNIKTSSIEYLTLRLSTRIM